MSIPAQRRELLEFAKRQGLIIVREPIEESQSAKQPGRPFFNRMLVDLSNRQADAILCWHVDRLARNPEDGGRLMQMLQDGVIREIRTPMERHGIEDDPMILSVAFGVSTKYVKDLSRNVRRGIRTAFALGLWPHHTKLGYMRKCPCPPGMHTDRHRNLPLVPDERFRLVRRLWELKLVGVSVAELARRARNEWGLRTPTRGRQGGRPLAISQLYRLFRDPFYAGSLRHGEQTYVGNHQPMITWDEFELVRRMLSKRRSDEARPKRHSFVFGGGLINCGACDAKVTAQFTTNRFGTRYVYYHCCRKRKRYAYCAQPSIEERVLMKQFAASVAALVLPPHILADIKRVLPRLLAEHQETDTETTRKLEALIAEKDRFIERARRLYVEERVSEGEFVQDRERLLSEQRMLRAQLEKASDPARRLKPIVEGISLLTTALSVVRNGDSHERRELAQKLFSNLTLTGKSLVVQAKEPYGLLAAKFNIPAMSGYCCDVKTRRVSGATVPMSASNVREILVEVASRSEAVGTTRVT